jgi:hypothetical protein
MYFNINGIDRIPYSHRMLPSLFTPIPFVYAIREIYHREDEKVSMVLLVSVWKIPVNTHAKFTYYHLPTNALIISFII